MLDILFICHGNICRSPLAEFVMKDLTERQGLAGKFQIASAATSREELGNDIHPGTRRVLEREGIPFPPVRHAKSRKAIMKLTTTSSPWTGQPAESGTASGRRPGREIFSFPGICRRTPGYRRPLVYGKF